MVFRSKTKVLLVDDNEGDVLLISDAISDLDQSVEIKVLREGKATLEFLHSLTTGSKHFIPDLILLDINLPFVSGLEILEFIKRKDALKKTPVVVLTCSSSMKNITDAYGNHANCYITKPALSQDYKGILKDILFFWDRKAEKNMYD